MRGRLFNVLALLSSLLLAASAVAWGWSHYALGDLRWEMYQPSRGSYRAFRAVAYRGGLFLDRQLLVYAPAEYPTHWRAEPEGEWQLRAGWDRTVGYSSPVPTVFGFGVARYRTSVRTHPKRDDRLVLPFWFLLLLFGVPPVLSLARRRAARRRECRRAGRCVRCGYDLRATPDRCPECGTPATRKLNPGGEATSERDAAPARKPPLPTPELNHPPVSG